MKVRCCGSGAVWEENNLACEEEVRKEGGRKVECAGGMESGRNKIRKIRPHEEWLKVFKAHIAMGLPLPTEPPGNVKVQFRKLLKARYMGNDDAVINPAELQCPECSKIIKLFDGRIHCLILHLKSKRHQNLDGRKLLEAFLEKQLVVKEYNQEDTRGLKNYTRCLF